MDADALPHWDRAAAGYSAHRRDRTLAGAEIYEPAIDELVGDVSGKRVLDAGCGDGTDARMLAARGAVVTAIDGSSEMIGLARRHADHPGIEYAVADLTAALALPDRHFDLVLARMVLMDLPRIDVAIGEIARVLVPGGAFVFALTHPCFFISDWVSDERGEKVHKAVSDYLSPQTEELHFFGTTLHFHRPLSHYFDELGRHRLLVDALKEPVPSDAALARRPDWAYHRRVPSFIVARARLCPGVRSCNPTNVGLQDLTPSVARAQRLGGRRDGLDDEVVAGAAAEVSGDGLADLFRCGRRVLAQERLDGQDDAGRAEAALKAVVRAERFLDRMQMAFVAHTGLARPRAARTRPREA